MTPLAREYRALMLARAERHGHRVPREPSRASEAAWFVVVFALFLAAFYAAWGI